MYAYIDQAGFLRRTTAEFLEWTEPLWEGGIVHAHFRFPNGTNLYVPVHSLSEDTLAQLPPVSGQRDLTLAERWQDFRTRATYRDDQHVTRLEAAFWRWPAHTPVIEIFHWFDEQGVLEDLIVHHKGDPHVQDHD